MALTDELQAAVDEIFAEADANKDGKITKQEDIDYHTKMGMQIDQEAMADLDKFYEEFDTNKNGALEKSELYNYIKKMDEEMQKH